MCDDDGHFIFAPVLESLEDKDVAYRVQCGGGFVHLYKHVNKEIHGREGE